MTSSPRRPSPPAKPSKAARLRTSFNVPHRLARGAVTPTRVVALGPMAVLTTVHAYVRFLLSAQGAPYPCPRVNARRKAES
jgi:hypothetical protein